MLDTQVNGIAALAGTFLFLTTATVVLRLTARFRAKNPVSIDDYLAVAAWVGFIGLSALAFYGITHDFIGHRQPHDKTIVNKGHPMLEQVYTVLNAFTAWTLGTAKLSALFFLRRIFCPIRSWSFFQVITWFYIFIVASWTIIFFILPFNLCPGHSYAWSIQPGHSAECSLVYPYFEASTISDFILDVLILILPIPKIWALNATTYRKLAITGVFLFALVGLAASLARMIMILHLVLNGRAINDEDSYQSNSQTAYFAILEGGCTIIAVNMPSLWYFLSGISPERVLRSVRSLASLRSGGDTQEDAKDDLSGAASSDQTRAQGLTVDSKHPHAHANNTYTDAHAVADKEPILSYNKSRPYEEHSLHASGELV